MQEEAHAHAADARQTGLPPIGWGVVAAVALVVAGAWYVTWRSSADFMMLIDRQLAGAAPTETLTYLALSGVMMVAMMLPSAMPMVRVYRGLAGKDPGTVSPAARTSFFVSGYFVVWTLFAGVALVVLMGLGLLGTLGGWMRVVPGLLLVAAGTYQFTSWKRFCLRHCRTPTGFVLTHWRSGTAGALRMGVAHGGYCLGCCWLLMLLLFVAGAMSILWMGFFAGLVLMEKTWGRGEGYARAMGIVGILVGSASAALAALAVLGLPLGVA